MELIEELRRKDGSGFKGPKWLREFDGVIDVLIRIHWHLLAFHLVLHIAFVYGFYLVLTLQVKGATLFWRKADSSFQENRAKF
jgi:hypothetical protein